MEIILDSEKFTLSIDGSEIVLERPYNKDCAYLADYGAIKKGNLLTKRFPRSRFLILENEIKARLEIFQETCDFVSGMSGYSELNATRCAELGIRVGQYEAAVTGLMTSAINRVRAKIPKARYGLVYGSSALGVDLAIENVAAEQNLPLIGFTCPEYLWYVSNNSEGPHVCVMKTKTDYCHAYVENCNLLMASNGGAVSYQKDIIAATMRMIPVLPINVIGMLGASIPAFKPDGSVNDAVGALLHVMRLVSFQTQQGLADDRYDHAANEFANAVTARAREVVPPQYAYEPLKN
jgi:hypothetical protein